MLIDVVVIVLVLLLIGAFSCLASQSELGIWAFRSIGVIVAILIILLMLHVV